VSDRADHLEMIQSVVSRLGQNSFALKGWTVTLVAALLTVSVHGHNPHVALVAALPTALLGLLDAYYLWQERLFRALYDSVRARPEGTVDFSMDTDPFRANARWTSALTSAPVLGFYLVILGAVAIVYVVLLARH